MCAFFNKLFCIVPGPTSCVEEQGHQYASDCCYHQESSSSFIFEHNSDDDGDSNYQKPGQNHLFKGSFDADVHNSCIIRLLPAGHYSFLFFPLPPDFIHYAESSISYSPYGKCAEEEYQHSSNQGADKHVNLRDVHSYYPQSRILCDIIKVSGEQQECSQCSASYRIAFCQCLCGISHGVKLVCPLSYRFI